MKRNVLLFAISFLFTLSIPCIARTSADFASFWYSASDREKASYVNGYIGGHEMANMTTRTRLARANALNSTILRILGDIQVSYRAYEIIPVVDYLYLDPTRKRFPWDAMVHYAIRKLDGENVELELDHRP